jgi:hypothetical protein
MRRYLRFIIVEGGMNGLFQYRTPREYIEGYLDPLIVLMGTMPVYNGGDTTNNPFMSLNSAPTGPLNNPIALF